MNFVFLSSISGPLVRLILSIRAGSPWLNAVCATLVDRIFSISILMAMGVAALPLAAHIIGAIDVTRAYAIFAGVIFLGAFGAGSVIFFYGDWIKRIMGPRLFRVARSYGLRLFSSWHFGLAVLYSIVGQLSFFLGVYFVLCALHVPLSFINMMSVFPVVLPLLAVLISLPISIGGWGLRESGYVLGLGIVGVSIENAFLASVLVGTFTMATAVLMAIPTVARGWAFFEIHDDFKPYQSALAHLRSRVR